MCACVCNETVCVLLVVFVLKSIHVTSFHITILFAQCVHMCIHTHTGVHAKLEKFQERSVTELILLPRCKFPYVDSIL